MSSRATTPEERQRGAAVLAKLLFKEVTFRCRGKWRDDFNPCIGLGTGKWKSLCVISPGTKIEQISQYKTSKGAAFRRASDDLVMLAKALDGWYSQTQPAPC
jgi:hypothetical protein